MNIKHNKNFDLATILSKQLTFGAVSAMLCNGNCWINQPQLKQMK